MTYRGARAPRTGRIQQLLAILVGFTLAAVAPAAGGQADPCVGASDARFNQILVIDCTSSMTSPLPAMLKQGSVNSRWDWAVAESRRVVRDLSGSPCRLLIMPFGHMYQNAQTGGLPDVGIFLDDGRWVGPQTFDLSESGQVDRAMAYIDLLQPREDATHYAFARFRGLQEAIKLSAGGSEPTRLTVLTDETTSGSRDWSSGYRRDFVFLLNQFDPDNDLDDGEGLTFKGKPGKANHFELKCIGVPVEPGRESVEQASAVIRPTRITDLPTLSRDGVPFAICVKRAPFSAGFQPFHRIALQSLDPRVSIEPPVQDVPPGDGGKIEFRARLAQGQSPAAEGLRDVPVQVTLEPRDGVAWAPKQIFLTFAPDEFRTGPIEPRGSVAVGTLMKFRLTQLPAGLQSIEWSVQSPTGKATTQKVRQPDMLEVRFDEPGAWRIAATALGSRGGSSMQWKPEPIEINCVDISCRLEGPTKGRQGEALTFRATSKAPIDRAGWRATRRGQGRDALQAEIAPKISSPSEATFEFSEPGEWDVRLEAINRQFSVPVRASAGIRVDESPSVTMIRPSGASRADAGFELDIQVLARGLAGFPDASVVVEWVGAGGGAPVKLALPNDGRVRPDGGTGRFLLTTSVRMPPLPPNVKSVPGTLRARLDLGPAAANVPVAPSERPIELLPAEFTASRVDPPAANPGISSSRQTARFQQSFTARFTGQQAVEVSRFRFEVLDPQGRPLQEAREGVPAQDPVFRSKGHPPCAEPSFAMDLPEAGTPRRAVVQITALDASAKPICAVKWDCSLSVAPEPRRVQVPAGQMQAAPGQPVEPKLDPPARTGETVSYDCPEEPATWNAERNAFVFRRLGTHQIVGVVSRDGKPDPNTPVTPAYVTVEFSCGSPFPGTAAAITPGQTAQVPLQQTGWIGADLGQCEFEAVLKQSGKVLQPRRSGQSNALMIATTEEDRGDIEVRAYLNFPPSLDGTPAGRREIGSTLVQCRAPAPGLLKITTPETFWLAEGPSTIPATAECSNLKPAQLLGFWRTKGSGEPLPSQEALMDAMRGEGSARAADAARMIQSRMGAAGFHPILNGGIPAAEARPASTPQSDVAAIAPTRKTQDLEVVFIGVGEGATVDDRPKIVMSVAPMTLRMPIDWGRLLALLAGSGAITWLLWRVLRGNDPLRWTFAADVEFGDPDDTEMEREQRVPGGRASENYPWPFEASLGRGRVLRTHTDPSAMMDPIPGAELANPALFEADMVCRSWWRGPFFSPTRKKIDLPLSSLVQAILALEGPARPQVRTMLPDLLTALAGTYLRLETVPSYRFSQFDPRFSTWGGERLLDPEPGAGGQNPGSPVKVYELIVQDYPRVKMHLRVRLSEGLGRNLTTGLLNIMPPLILVGSWALIFITLL